MFVSDSKAYADTAFKTISVAVSGFNHQYEVVFNEFGVITPQGNMERDEKEIRPVVDLEI